MYTLRSGSVVRKYRAQSILAAHITLAVVGLFQIVKASGMLPAHGVTMLSSSLKNGS
jgi:hypothetical protein